MKSLVIAQDFPWPTNRGAHLRLDSVIRALVDLGETDLVALAPARRREPCEVPEGLAIHRVDNFVRPRPHLSIRRRISWLMSGLPLEVSEARVPEAKQHLQAARDHYDFVWISRGDTFEVLGRPRLGPTVIDIDDLEDFKILSRLQASNRGDDRRRECEHGTYEANVSQPEAADDAGVLTTPAQRGRTTMFGFGSHNLDASREKAAVIQARFNARRWRNFQRSIASQVARVAVCSELDLRRLNVQNALVVPNGYEAPESPVGRDEVGTPPTVLFAGDLCYPPNADAASWLVTQVLPRLSVAVPDVQIRLVGEPNTSVAEFASCRAVTVVGRVPEMRSELAKADVVVVPIRIGSGTRIKILEAFAHRIPVVSTAKGAEGLDVENKRELFIADGPDSFADSCATLTKETQTRRALADAAQSLFLKRFQWSVARDRVREIATELAGNSST